MFKEGDRVKHDTGTFGTVQADEVTGNWVLWVSDGGCPSSSPRGNLHKQTPPPPARTFKKDDVVLCTSGGSGRVSRAPTSTDRYIHWSKPDGEACASSPQKLTIFRVGDHVDTTRGKGVIKSFRDTSDNTNQLIVNYICEDGSEFGVYARNVTHVDQEISEIRVTVGLTKDEAKDWRVCTCCGGHNREPFLIYGNMWEEPRTAYGHKVGCRVGTPGAPVE